MKKFLLIACLSVALLSCSKENNDNGLRSQQVLSSSPAVTSVTWASINEAGDLHPKFSVQLNIPDSNAVKLINLKCVNAGTVCWTVSKPKTGSYIMYDHVRVFPTYNSQTYYQFEFEMTSGSKISLDKFQVY